MGFKEKERGLRHLQGTYFCEPGLQGLFPEGQFSSWVALSREEDCLVVGGVYVGGGGWWWGEPRKVVSVMVMSSFPLLTPPQVKVSWGVLAQERVSCMAEIES